MRFLQIVVFLVFSSGPIYSQTCEPPVVVANKKAANFFSPEQEMYLGELTVQRLAREFRPINDPQLVAFVTSIGEKIIKHLPPTGLKFTFHIIDFPEANAFNIPGGHVFLTRKLIALSKNEDELASVIAHELGHAAVRHGAIDMTDSMKQILKINAVGDKKDIIEKYNLLIENARTRRVSRSTGHENEQQLEADSIGLYGMVAAGYDPNATFTFFDRLTESKGKTGSWFSNIFGGLPPAQKRLREIADATMKLPAVCRDGRSAKPTEDYLKWQADIVQFRQATRIEVLPGIMWKQPLSPKLRSDVSHLKFSPDGKLLLAQDDFGITILQREPLQTLFQIPIEAAEPAAFTPDGKSVVFITENLRFERWSLEQRAATEVRELVIRRNCSEATLSPNGNYLACVDGAGTASVIDTSSGEKIWEKKGFYRFSIFEIITFYSRSRRDDDDDTTFFRVHFTPDSRHVLFSRSDRFRFRFRVDMATIAKSSDVAISVDLTTKKDSGLAGNLRGLASRPYVFLDNERVFGLPDADADDAGVFSFPEGKRLQKLKVWAPSITPTENPDLVVLRPMQETDLGVFDVKRNVLVTGMDKRDVAIWKNLIAYESAAGSLMVREFSYDEKGDKLDSKEIAKTEIPASAMSNLQAASVSNSLEWLKISSKTRGGVWSLKNGQRKVYVRGFRGAVVGEDGGGLGLFPKLRDTPPSLVLTNPNNGAADPLRELPTKGVRQHGRFILVKTPLNEKKAAKIDKEANKNKPQNPSAEESERSLYADVRFELKDIVTDKVIWTREFPKEAPGYSFDNYSGRLLFFWQPTTEGAKLQMKDDPAMKAKAEALGNNKQDFLVEVVDAFETKTIGSVAIETGKGSFSALSALSEGDWLIVYDTAGRVLTYSISANELRHRFFGHHAAANPRRNQIIVENAPGELNLYNLDTGDSDAKFIIKGKAAFVRFTLDGTRLFVLSDQQVAYAFDLTKLPAPEKREIVF